MHSISCGRIRPGEAAELDVADPSHREVLSLGTYSPSSAWMQNGTFTDILDTPDLEDEELRMPLATTEAYGSDTRELLPQVRLTLLDDPLVLPHLQDFKLTRCFSKLLHLSPWLDYRTWWKVGSGGSTS